MRQSTLFTRTAKTAPEGEEAKNAELLIRGGFISKSSAGVYSFLPLGLRVLEKINSILREEMNALGAEEMLMPALIAKRYWEQSGRWESDIVYRAGKKGSGGAGAEYGLGWTHEEVVTAIAVNFIQSYRDLPKAVYQIQTKFRAEARAQAGLLRGREFPMKDLYSFHADKTDLEKFYALVIASYKKIFDRLALKTVVAETGGGAFTSEYTHEFQVISGAGEDTIYSCDRCGFAQNKEIFKEERHTGCAGNIAAVRAIEVGNVFRLGTRFSEAFHLQYLDTKGERRPVYMGSYGIGPGRAMGAIVEAWNDERGIIWPEAVAPFQVHLLALSKESAKTRAAAEKAYAILQKAGISVFYDDRGAVSAGEKFADADLIGIPFRAVISEKTIPQIELKRRNEKSAEVVSIAALRKTLGGKS